MKTTIRLLLAVSLLSSTTAFAEHDRTYCGFISANPKARTDDGDKPDAVLVLEDSEYGALYFGEDQDAERKLVDQARKDRATVCVKGRWGGAPYSSTKITAISLLTTGIERVDYEENFSEEDLAYGED